MNPASLFSISEVSYKREVIRKQREFIPENQKDEGYWNRRRRNNEAARRSREKRRLNDLFLEHRIAELARENFLLKTELSALREKIYDRISYLELLSEEDQAVNLPQVLPNRSCIKQICKSTFSLPYSCILPLKLRHKSSQRRPEIHENQKIDMKRSSEEKKQLFLCGMQKSLKDSPDNLEYENSQLKYQIQQLASEVDSLKCLLKRSHSLISSAIWDAMRQ